ncbi:MULTISPECIES: SurA N-terminal domain-containing protein [Nitrosomonas]|uniref:Periplasmic chaperone PpiD n=1 Tax=Nitrosomonas europaea (strain ATCC 19718 / CIP 103999 / KCTC 2705 / NBRC 14298) TaxID=228410 RepID=Q82SU8_NITEU|nr:MULTISPECIES: SurA N-terminal domain-containing protein [Nitrosomonas]CAD86118.1 PpiC-type peptidyl-prolyl cis-trans isomerase [Nitrosomonas europaea ATCC 19718]SDW83913.1 peptidyl-prolyl cis-trans isomerase D [Nitrosomonas europaea]SJZ92366.1 peptidyl-prolyl cis-trans isomerase D [Nitrosomonas europaea]HBF24023.1 peptidylprolyl isomerase [Nitrosomonas sp.]
MFDFVNKKKTVVQIVLLIAVLPFMFWGVESYRSAGDAGYAAVVDGEEISRQEYEQAIRNQQENLRNMLGEKFDASLLDNPQMRLAVLENLIQERLLRREAERVGLTVLDSRLTAEIQNISFFHEDEKFSYQRYRDLLQRQGMSPAMFEARVAGELMRQQLLEGITGSVIVPRTVAGKVASLSATMYEINRMTISPEQYIDQAEPDEAAIQSYYDSHYQDFTLPERVKVEYVVLSLDELARQEQISDEEIRKYYDEHQDEFGQAEERRASHILLSVPADATEEQKTSTKARAEQILEQVRQDPEKLPELAAELSEDPGSAKEGGDLGFFARGLMVKPFEDEVFQMQRGEIRGPVETPFGFHIIRLTEVKGADVAGLDDVKEQIRQLLQHQKVADRFGELSEDFSNIVYEQNDTLQPVAQMFNLSVQQSDWIDRNSREPSVITNERMLQAIFSESAVRDHFNTESIEVAPDTFVAARVVEHRPASAQSIGLVKDRIVALLKQQLASEQAENEGKQKLAGLQAGEVDESLEWGESSEVSFAQKKGDNEEILHALFQTDVEKLPAYTGVVTSKGGYDLIRINQVKRPDIGNESSQYNLLFDQLQQIYGQEELSAYIAGLRQRYEVTIRPLEEND